MPDVEELVAASQNGSSEAFGKIYDLMVDPIYRYLFFRVGEADAEDLTELVFLKAWENINSYRHGFKSFSSWIFRIAHNIVVDHYRSSRVNGELTEDLADLSADNQIARRANNHFDSRALAQAMGKLKDNYRQVLILKFINDMSNDEICFVTGKSSAALRILQFRALKHLRRILVEMGFNPENV